MRDIKFRLIEDNKIVGYEKHSHSGSEGLKIFHSVINDDSKGWEWWNTNDLRKWIRHDEKEQYLGVKDTNEKEIFEGDIDISGMTVAYCGDQEGGLGMNCGWYLQEDDWERWIELESRYNENGDNYTIVGTIHEKENENARKMS